MRVAANVPHDFSGLDHATGWPEWSPDGRWIAFDRGSATVMRADGRRKRLLSGQLWMPGWAPNARTLTGAGLTSGCSPPGRSDGRRLVLVRQCCGTHDYSTVTTIPARGGRERVRFRRSYHLGAVDWQPR